MGQGIVEGDPGRYRAWTRFRGSIIEVADIPTTLHGAEIQVAPMEENPDYFSTYQISAEQIKNLDFEPVADSHDVLLFSTRYDVPVTVTLTDILATDSPLRGHVKNILVRLRYSNGPKREIWLCRTVVSYRTRKGGLVDKSLESRSFPPERTGCY